MVSAPAAPRCLTCASWHPPADDIGPGQCRRRSPRAVQDHRNGSWRSQWPPVWGVDWCRDHAPKEEPEPEETER